MFLALRELKFARGRFGLMGAVIAMIAVLMVMLSGLSSGLVNDGVSGLKSLPVTAFAFDGGHQDRQRLLPVRGRRRAARRRGAGNRTSPRPRLMGVGMANATTGDGRQVDVTLFGVEPDPSWTPRSPRARAWATSPASSLSPTAKGAGVEIGTVLTLDRLDTELTVVGFTDGQATFGHVDVAYLPLATWQLIASARPRPESPRRSRSMPSTPTPPPRLPCRPSTART